VSLSLAHLPLPVRSAGWQLSFVWNGPVAARSWVMGRQGYGVVGFGVLPGEFFFRSGLSCRDLGLAWVTESSEATAMPRRHRVSMPGPPPNNAMNQTNRGVTVSGSGAPVESPC
jgi:hypothetical protein